MRHESYRPFTLGDRRTRAVMTYRKGESPWTPQRMTKVLQLWSQGLTKAEIAERMGSTKNAVIGLIGRLRKAGVDIPHHTNAGGGWDRCV